MLPDDRGTSTVEALVALTLFALVGLSAAASAALSLRAATEGSHAARAARLATAIAQDLGRLSRTHGGCRSLVPGRTSAPSGESARWWFEPALGGAAVHIEVSYQTVRRQHSDSLWSFVRC
jgi:type II secretory pathway component PulJ